MSAQAETSPISIAKASQILLTLLLVALCFSPTLLLHAKFIVDGFSASRSPFKVFLLLGFALIALQCCNKQGWLPSQRAVTVLKLLTILLLGIGVLELYYLWSKFNLNLDSLLFIVSNGEGTRISLHHNNLGKLAFGALAERSFSQNVLYSIEPGIAPLGFFPNWLPLLHGLLYLGFAVLLLRSMPIIGIIALRYRFVWFLSCFTLFKNTLDGGLFYVETVFALPLFLLFLSRGVRETKPTAKLVGLSIAGSTLVSCLLTPIFDNVPRVLGGQVPSLLLTYLSLWLVGYLIEKKSSVNALLFFICYLATNYILVLGLGMERPYSFLLRYNYQKLFPGQTISLTAHETLKPEKLGITSFEVQRVGNLNRYDLTINTMLLVHELVAIGAKPYFHQVDIHGVDCDTDSPHEHKYRVLEAIPHLPLGKTQIGPNSSVTAGHDSDGQYLQFSLRGCSLQFDAILIDIASKLNLKRLAVK